MTLKFYKNCLSLYCQHKILHEVNQTMDILEFITEHVLGAILTAIGGILLLYWRKLKTLKKNIEISLEALQAIIRADLIKSFLYAERRKYVTLEEHEAICMLFQVYHALGGNGTLNSLKKQFENIRIVKDEYEGDHLEHEQHEQ